MLGQVFPQTFCQIYFITFSAVMYLYVCSAAAHGIHFSPFVGIYRVNEEIACAAQGYPLPSIHWVVVSSNSSRQRTGGPVLRITADMVGNNRWHCLAVNSMGSAQRLHAFRVVGMISYNNYYYHNCFNFYFCTHSSIDPGGGG